MYKKQTVLTAVAVIGAATWCAPALAAVTVTQGASAPTYGTTLTFDEPGGPTGSVAGDAWLVSHGITAVETGDFGAPQVADWTGTFGPWVGIGNSVFGNGGVTFTFDSPITELSAQVWAPAGAPGPFGGGLGVFVFDGATQVAGGFGELVEPAWGGIGDEWYNITTDAGMTFDRVQFFSNGNDLSTFVDTLSWNVVPEPTSFALFGLAGAALLRRRR